VEQCFDLIERQSTGITRYSPDDRNADSEKAVVLAVLSRPRLEESLKKSRGLWVAELA
jgi:hypothetical protein